MPGTDSKISSTPAPDTAPDKDIKSTSSTATPKKPKTDQELIKHAEHVRKTAIYSYERNESYPHCPPYKKDDQKEAYITKLQFGSSLEVFIESGTNCKKEPTPNQDAATAAMFDLPANMTRAAMIKMISKTAKQTSNAFHDIKYSDAGTTFTTCAIAILPIDEKNSELVVTCAQAGDSGAGLLGEKEFTPLTPSHGTASASPSEIIRTKANLAFDKNCQYLANGCSFHQLSSLPSKKNRRLFVGSYIFSEKNPFNTSCLYYIVNKTRTEKITINNFESFKEELDKIKKNPHTFRLYQTAKNKSPDKRVSWNLCTDQTKTSIRLTNFQMHALIGKYCAPHSNVMPQDKYKGLKRLGMTRSFGDYTLQRENGALHKPQISQMIVPASNEKTAIVYTDGIFESLKPSELTKLSNPGEIREEAYKRGSKDDIKCVRVKLKKDFPRNKILVISVADAHGHSKKNNIIADKIADNALTLFTQKLEVTLGSSNQPTSIVTTPANFAISSEPVLNNQVPLTPKDIKNSPKHSMNQELIAAAEEILEKAEIAYSLLDINDGSTAIKDKKANPLSEIKLSKKVQSLNSIIITTEIVKNRKPLRSTVKNTQQSPSDIDDKPILSQNQDSTETVLFNLPPNMTRATMIKALEAAANKTRADLSNSNYACAGTTFTACAVAMLPSDEKGTLAPIITSAQAGDSGAALIDENNKFKALTPNHNISLISVSERERIKANLLRNSEGTFLTEGCTFCSMAASEFNINNDYSLYAGGYIFIERKPFANSELYYITEQGKPQKAAIHDFSAFEKNLDAIKADPSTEWVTINEAGMWSSLEIRKPSGATYAIRLRNNQISLIQKNCDPDSKIIPINNSTSLSQIGNARSFGNYALQERGIGEAPEISQMVIPSTTTGILLFTDGATDKLTPSQLAKLCNNNGSICKEAYLRGSIDDCSVIIVKKDNKISTISFYEALCKELKNKILVFLAADAHGSSSGANLIAKEAIEKFIKNFQAELKLIQQATSAATPSTPLNSQMLARSVVTQPSAGSSAAASATSSLQQQTTPHPVLLPQGEKGPSL